MPRFAFQNAASTIPDDSCLKPTKEVQPQRAVLIADDEPSVRRALTRAMERAGYEVLIATDVPGAISVARLHRPRFAVVDLHMPRGSGLDVVRSLKQSPDEVHIMVLSGDPAMQSRVECFDAGAHDYVAKPVYMPELVSRIRAAEKEQDDRRALALEKRRAEQLYIYAKEMASFLAHDLNNGFCVALANLSYLSLHKDVDEECNKAMASTLWVLHRMSALTANFLDIERLEEGELKPRRMMVPLHKLVSDVLVLDHTRQADEVSVRVDCDADLQVYVDGPLLERVLHNIVGNAMRYVNAKGEIAVTVRSYATDLGHEALTIQVSNCGKGIPEATCKKLFDRLDHPRDSKSRRGLGLYFCRLVCEAHGGTIGVTSTKGITTFTLELSCA